MKYCTKCGNELIDEAVVCTKCGCLVESDEKNEIADNENNRIQKGSVSDQAMAAKILMFLTCAVYVAVGIALLFIVYPLYGLLLFLPVFWCCPMAFCFSKKLKTNKKVGVGFKVCTLLFVNVLSGIFMILDSDC